MSGESTIRERLRFNMIDQETVAILREAKSFILAEMPLILDGFYDHIGNFAETAKFFRSREHMMHAKKMQLLHWQLSWMAALTKPMRLPSPRLAKSIISLVSSRAGILAATTPSSRVWSMR